MFKLVKLLINLTHLLAVREEKAQAAKQVAFKKRKAADALAYRAKQRNLQAQADKLAQDASLANAQAALGCNKINEAQRVAGTLRGNLSYLTQK